MKVVVTYESRTGTTKRAAQLVGGGLQAAGADVSVVAVETVGYGELATADLVIVGTWTDGLFFFGQRPGGAGKIARHLPELWDKGTYSFVTYAVNPGKSHEKLGGILRALGAISLGEAAFHRHRLEDEVAEFVDSIIDEFASS
ncbi:MAG: flavodoxin family protein [Acidimicrobiales bacterium]